MCKSFRPSLKKTLYDSSTVAQILSASSRILYCWHSIQYSHLVIIRPHRVLRTAAYCYRPSSVVCLSAGLSHYIVSSAETAEPIEIPFALRTRVGPGNDEYIVSWANSIPMGSGNFERGKEGPIVKSKDICGHLYKNG